MALAVVRDPSSQPGMPEGVHAPPCQVVTRTLSKPDQHVLLVSHACLNLLSPADAVLFACQFDTSQMQLLKDACKAAPAPPGSRRHTYSNSFQDIEPNEVDEKPLPGNNFNLAHLLVCHAAHKVADVRVGKPTGYTADIGVLSVALDWPKSMTSHQINMAKVMETRRVNNPVATFRWHLACQFNKFCVMRRRRLLRSWWDVCAAALRHAEDDARLKEVAAWKYMGEVVKVSRTGQVVRSDPNTPATGASDPGGASQAAHANVALPATSVSEPGGGSGHGAPGASAALLHAAAFGGSGGASHDVQERRNGSTDGTSNGDAGHHGEATTGDVGGGEATLSAVATSGGGASSSSSSNGGAGAGNTPTPRSRSTFLCNSTIDEEDVLLGLSRTESSAASASGSQATAEGAAAAATANGVHVLARVSPLAGEATGGSNGAPAGSTGDPSGSSSSYATHQTQPRKEASAVSNGGLDSDTAAAAEAAAANGAGKGTAAAMPAKASPYKLRGNSGGGTRGKGRAGGKK